MRVTDVFLSVPALVLAMAVVGRARPGDPERDDRAVAGVVAGLRAAGQAKTLASAASRTSRRRGRRGTGRLRIVCRHILPNCVSPIMVKTSMDIGRRSWPRRASGFIGLGAKPPTSGVGRDDLHRAQLSADWWWYSAFPGLAIYLPCSASIFWAMACATFSTPRAGRDGGVGRPRDRPGAYLT